MYVVTLINDNITTEIQGKSEKLRTGSIVEGINAIDSFSISMLPNNKGFHRIKDFKTLVHVYNTNRNRYEYYGRVLHSTVDMNSKGLITKEVICESYLGFLCDSQQSYVEEQNWTVNGLLEHIVSVHNSQVEDYKKFEIGEVTVTDPNDNLYIGIQRNNSWDTIKEKLINTLGGEISFRVVDGVNYLDYLEEAGEMKTTEIRLSHNMKAIRKEKDPSAYITRLIPYGCKLSVEKTTVDENGNEFVEIVETEERLDITSVNDGLNYIDDEQAIEEYGIHVGTVIFDDVTDAGNLLLKSRNYLAENNKVQIKYSITSLNLSLLGLDIDDFHVRNRHPIKNSLLGIDDTARIVKKIIDVCDETKSTIEVGDNFKTLSDLQLEQSGKIESVENTIGKIENDYVTNEKLYNETRTLNSLIQQTVDNILLKVEEKYVTETENESSMNLLRAELNLFSDQIKGTISEVSAQIESVNGDLQEKYNTITKYFTVDINGLIIGQIDNPFRVIIDNDRYSMTVNGVEVLWLNPDGKSSIPELEVIKSFQLMGYMFEKDNYDNVNCKYVGGDA